MIDTLQVITNSLTNEKMLMESTMNFYDILDYAYKIAMVVIAIFNACFAVYIYNSNSRKSSKDKDADRKIALLKLNFSFISLLLKIMPPRGPRSVLCVVVVVTCAYGIGLG